MEVSVIASFAFLFDFIFTWNSFIDHPTRGSWSRRRRVTRSRPSWGWAEVAAAAAVAVVVGSVSRRLAGCCG